MLLAVNTKWTPEFWGEAPNGIDVSGHFIVWSHHKDLHQALRMCNVLKDQGLRNFQVDIVEDYNIYEYELCTRKTYLLRLIQRKWKRLYKNWKRKLPKYIIEAQIYGKRCKTILR
jgi:hypothetical protein